LGEERVKLALLKGNRFNPWHLQAFNLLPDTEVVAFRANSEIQRLYDGQDDGSAVFPVEPIYYDTQMGPALARFKNTFLSRYGDREARVMPFAERLRGFDLIHTWELFTDWTGQALDAREQFGIPTAVMVWDNIPFNMERDVERRRLKERASTAADVFIVHTERSRRMLEMEHVPADKIATVDPGVDTRTFSPGPRDRATLGLRDDEFVILFVGWLLPRKGIDFLILALHELVRDPELARFKFRLAVVGTGPGRDRVERLIARTGLESRCSFLGSLTYDRMPAAFRAADVFVLPSIATPEWQEQFGMAIIEAMACGTPVVTTLSGAIPEITDDKAVLCQPNDFVSLYQAVRELALDADKRIAMGAAARQHALDRFTLEGFAKNLAAIYGPLMKAAV
jgi:glycosyltransferase involved in cell wall biosynthesis